jgi:hypothetical protein
MSEQKESKQYMTPSEVIGAVRRARPDVTAMDWQYKNGFYELQFYKRGDVEREFPRALVLLDNNTPFGFQLGVTSTGCKLLPQDYSGHVMANETRVAEYTIDRLLSDNLGDTSLVHDYCVQMCHSIIEELDMPDFEYPHPNHGCDYTASSLNTQ